MNIIYIGAFRLPNLDAGAPRVINNAKILRSLGHSVKFISWGGEYSQNYLCNDGKYRVNGFEYCISNELISSDSFFDRLIAKLFRGTKSIQILKSFDRPDLIILYNASYSFTTRIKKFCNTAHIKLANDINEWFDNNELKFIDIVPNYLNMTCIQKMVKNKIVISSYLDNYYSESNNVLVPPLCDKEESKWYKTIEDNRVPHFDGITLIYAGTPGKKDCVHTVINAVNAIAIKDVSIRFMILGIDRESYLSRYSDYLLDTNLHENILFLGRVSQDDIPAYYKKADFMVLLRVPNRKSMAGFPTKFAESMTAGIPVISNSTSDIHQYIIQGKTGFLSEGYDYDSIFDLLINKIITLKPADISRMKQYTVQNNSAFDWKSYTEQFKVFLQNLK